MDEVDGDWSVEETERFLRERTIPVRLACRTSAEGLWMLSLWYRYRDGCLECATGVDARVVRYLERDRGVAFEVSTNDIPYMGVRGSGTATVEPDEGKSTLRSLVERYLDGTDSDLAKWLLSPDRDEVRITIDVDRAYAWDFSSRMDGSDD
ncbi:MAG: pyridoxamine 5'-phosphate oxidase family protein [Haloarculaceae archaeon]